VPETALSIPWEHRDEQIMLEGTLSAPDGEGPHPAVALCHPHPRFGGDMHNNVVSAVADALVQRGIAAIRFNFRGVGGSGGQHDDGAGEQADARAALAYASLLPEVDGDRIGLAGYSFGAGIAAAVATGAAVSALALIALPLRALSDQPSALAEYPNPALLLAGDSDDICPRAALIELAASLGSGVETRIVAGADHFWFGHEQEAGASAGEFFAARL
jgi:alpha/beta superfamily hydrolase